MAVDIFVMKLGNGGWVAATKSTPYFCFEGTTQEEVLAAAKRAVSVSARLVKELKSADR